ncbi:hypothetical protein [Dysgonomonas capnocytophagoides]|uniref:hypothetical protein n=1 Tax=Dysgonomonas capnocytophagoides TaxID=45254 RepID=UPI003340F68C
MNVTQEQLDRIRELYGETAYNQYLSAENTVKDKELSNLDRDWHIGQSYSKTPNAYQMQQHRHIDQIVKGTEPTQEQIDAIAIDAAKNILG